MSETRRGTESVSTLDPHIRERKDTSTPLLLVVDDDESLRKLLRQRLEGSYAIIDTGQAREALALALQHRPDAILLDLTMPELSGFELCQTLASLSHTRSIPIFVISGEPAAKYKAFCQNLGAVEYFEKPIDFHELKARLAVGVKGKHAARRSEVTVRLRVILKLVGADAGGTQFELLTTTDGVSTGGFTCGCGVSLQKESIVEVYLVGEEEQFVGRARAVGAEWHNTPFPRYTFRFVEKRSGQWVL